MWTFTRETAEADSFHAASCTRWWAQLDSYEGKHYPTVVRLSQCSKLFSMDTRQS